MRNIFFLLFLPLIGYSQQILTHSIIHDNIQRDYKIYIPASYDSSIASPLVFCLHGYGGSANSIMYSTDFNYIADTAGFIAVYPQGALLQGVSHWNVGGWTTASNIDDVGFIEILLDSISLDYNIDPNRVYSTGMSNGGYMSFLLACQLSNRIAAIASVTGSMTPQTYDMCNPQHPTPILQIHGTNDQVVPYLGDPSWTVSIHNVLQYWIDYNNCNLSAETEVIADIDMSDGSNVERKSWSDCDNLVVAEHLKIYGGGHQWPGNSGNMDIHAASEIWDFFSRYDIHGLIGLETYLEEEILAPHYLIKSTNLLGRNLSTNAGGILFYFYSDGQVEKKMLIE